MKHLFVMSFIFILIISGCQSSVQEEANLRVNVYSARHYDLDKALLEVFTQRTGIAVNVIDGKAEDLLERMERELDNVQADVFLTVGAEHLDRALNSNLLNTLTQSEAYASIDPMFYGERWVALTKRARVIVYDPEKTNILPKTYQDLALEEYANTILIRSAASTYNIALVADFIDRYGEEATRTWLAGFVANFARTPTGNDRDQAKSVLAGLGTYGIMNTYYVGLMLNSSDPFEKEVGEKIGVFFPEEPHINISWIGKTVNGPNPEAAQKLIDFLLEADQQSRYSLENGEYPVRDDVEINPLLKSWPALNSAQTDFEALGANIVKAILLMDEAGWQ